MPSFPGRFIWAALAVIFAVAAVAGTTWAVSLNRRLAEFEFEQRRMELMEAENARLRKLVSAEQARKSADGQVAAREEIEEAVADIRGLEFLTPVDYHIIRRADIREVINEKLAEVYSDEEFGHASATFATLGLLPEDYPLKEKYIDLLGEQIAAFYDQHKHSLHMFEDTSLDDPQTRIILAHELVHALQDQHFDLQKLPLEIKTNDDRALAASALVEGDATIVMSAYMVRDFSWRTLPSSIASVFTQNLEELQEAPRFLREMLLFPYMSGQEFCMVLQMQGGNEAISAAFADPPASTAQILHPEKYLATPREEPVPVEWDDLAVLGQEPVMDNVLGELGTRILLSEWTDTATATAAAAGWRGDRYLAFDNGDALVWKTVWRSPERARQFFEAAVRMLEKRYGADAVSKEDEAWWTDSPRHLILRFTSGSEVVLMSAGKREWAEGIAKKFLP